jgi:general stress protein 13
VFSLSKFAVGSIVKGKVTGIQPYGVFVALDEETQGLVHISEIAHGFVKDINEHVKVGDEVTVKVLSVDEESKRISLSMRAAESQPAKQALAEKKVKRQAKIKTSVEGPRGFNTLREKLQEWIEQSKREDLLNK